MSGHDEARPHDNPLAMGPTSLPKAPASWAMEVQTGGTDWDGNQVRLATKLECDNYGLNKALSWTMVSDVRSVPSDDVPNYRWTKGGLESL